MATVVEKTAFLVSVVDDVLAGELANAQVDLYKGTVPLNQNTVKADLVAQIANYDGYAQANIDWSTASISDDGQVELVGTVNEFRPTGSNVDNDITGFFLTANGDNSLLMFGAFDDGPIPMKATTDSLVVILRWRPKGPSVLVAIS